MKIFIKAFSVFCGLFSFVSMFLVAYGQIVLPDEAQTMSSSISFGKMYSAQVSYPSTLANASENDSNKSKTIQSEIRLFSFLPVKKISVNKLDRRFVNVGGELVGIRLYTDGVLVVGTESFETSGGTVSPASQAGILVGDILLSLNGCTITDNNSLTQSIEKSNGEPLSFSVKRNGEVISGVLSPQKSSITGKYKGGLWVRDSTSGIGTLTFSDPQSGMIASLGHAIFDVDTQQILPSTRGSLYNANISSVVKGCDGTAGEISGIIGETLYGTIDKNCEAGVYGMSDTNISGGILLPVACANEIEVGAAQIIATVYNGEKKYYDIEIEHISSDTDSFQKNMTIRITDNTLLAETGGIVQGMSGCPIIQNGMFVGAVTHVFLNNPNYGYAIFAENMLKVSDELYNRQYRDNAA